MLSTILVKMSHTHCASTDLLSLFQDVSTFIVVSFLIICVTVCSFILSNNIKIYNPEVLDSPITRLLCIVYLSLKALLVARPFLFMIV